MEQPSTKNVDDHRPHSWYLAETIPKDKSRPRKAQTFTDLSGLGNLKTAKF
jgi:hypothetical protein